MRQSILLSHVLCAFTVAKRRGRGAAGLSRPDLWLLPLLAFVSALPLRAAGQEGANEYAETVPAPIAGTELVGQVTVSLTVVVALLLALAWALRRFNRFQARGGVQLRVAGVLPLGARERILLVEAGTTRLLVGASPGGLRTLHVLSSSSTDEVDALKGGVE